MASYLEYLNQAFKNPDYIKAQQDLAEKQQALLNLQNQIPNYAVNKQKELLAADPEANRLTQERGKLVSQLYQQPFNSQESYKDILDPIKRDQLISQAVGNVLGQLSGTNTFIQNRRATAQDRANQALELLKAQVGTAETNVNSQGDYVKNLQSLLSTAAEKNFDAYQRALDRSSTQSSKKLSPFESFMQRGGRRIVNPDGSYSFVLNGQPISASDAATFTGGTLSDFLTGSTNPSDVKLLNDSKPLNQTQINIRSNAQTGLQSLNTIKDIVKNDANSLIRLKSKLPFGAGDTKAQILSSAALNAKDIITRIRTGAALNNQEIGQYEKFIPGIGDTQKTIDYKLGVLENFFNKISTGDLNGLSSIPSTDPTTRPPLSSFND